MYRYCAKLVLFGITFLAFALRTPASDAVTNISQATLTAYAVATGIQTGPQTFPVTIWVPILICTKGPFGGVICRWGFEKVTLWQQTIRWAVTQPGFVVTSQGVTFSGNLVVTGAGASAPTVPFTLSATAAYFSSSSLLWLIISPNPVSVPVTVSVGTYTVGIVISYYYNIRVPLSPVSFMISGQSLTGSLQNVNIQYSNGSITISNDFQIQ